MAYCKKFIIILLLLFIVFFNISSCFADEGWEDVSLNFVAGITATSSSNFFFSNPSGPGVNYFSVEKGYVYRVTVINTMQNTRVLVGTSEVPALNVTYDVLTSNLQYDGDMYTFIANTDTYAFVSLSPATNTTYIKIEKRKLDNINSAVDGLVENVGPNAFWGVFGSGLDFVFIIVIVAFGLFIIYKLIRGFSKGKSKI